MTNADIHNCHLLTIHIYVLVAVGITMLILCAMPSQQHQTEYSIFTTRQTIDAQSIQNTFFMMRIPGDTHILCIQLMQHNSQQLLVTTVQHVVWTAQRRILYQKVLANCMAVRSVQCTVTEWAWTLTSKMKLKFFTLWVICIT